MRELIARFGYHLALNWNLREENTQSPEEQRDMAKFIRDTDPYRHHIVVHTFPTWQDCVYTKFIGEQYIAPDDCPPSEVGRLTSETLPDHGRPGVPGRSRFGSR